MLGFRWSEGMFSYCLKKHTKLIFIDLQLYYITHPLFLSNQSIYLVVWNMTESEKEIVESVDYWMRAISLKAPESVVVLVGTHLDRIEEIESKQIPQQLMNEYNKLITKSFCVSSITGEGMNELREYLLDLAIQRQIDIPTPWLQLGQKLNEMKSTPTIGMDELRNVIKSSSISIDEQTTTTAIRVLHNLGYLLYYPPSLDDDIKQDLVILDPQWLVNILKAVVTVKNVEAINKGWLSHAKANLSNLWPQCKPEIHSFLLGLLYRFRIAIKSKGQSLIPCRLDQVPQTTMNQFTQLIYQMDFPHILPEDLFPTFIASPKALQYLNLENNTIWRDAAILQDDLGKNERIFIRAGGKNIKIFGSRLSEVVVEVIAFIIKLISNNWPGIIDK